MILVFHSCRVIGWAESNRIKRNLVIWALKMAIAFQSPSKDCIPYTDIGSQYWSHDYKKNMRQYDFQLAMSDKDNCYDKATVETVFKTIKVELV